MAASSNTASGRISNARVAILATHGFEKSELFEPRRRLREAGATVTVVSLESEPIRSWDDKDWGESAPVDLALADANVDQFDALVLPGGQINPDVLRTSSEAVDFVRAFCRSGKPVAAICHAPWLLVEAGVVADRDVTSYHSIVTDVKNAGGRWQDAAVVVDGNLITSRKPDDLPAFCDRIIEAIDTAGQQAASGG